MEIRVGEKICGVIEERKEEGYLVSLYNKKTGFAPDDLLADTIQPSNLVKGSEVQVRVEGKSNEGRFQLAITKVFNPDNFQDKPDKYLENLSQLKKTSAEPKKEKITEELEAWFCEIEETLEEINDKRKERLDEDLWAI